ncbi:MAG: cadherin repeat domain-containing protein, partial [Betaproteobacteria bacterium]|nr:cadherin repeat domain-containing protein [Betaproteobacteria bacterium]
MTIDSSSGVIRVHTPFTTAASITAIIGLTTGSEGFNTTNLTLRVVSSLAVSFTHGANPVDVGQTGEVGRVSVAGVAPFTLNFVGSRPNNIGVRILGDGSRFAIDVDTAFSEAATLTVTVVIRDGIGTEDTHSFSFTIAGPLAAVSLNPSAVTVTTGATLQNIARAEFTGGRAPFSFTLSGANTPPQVGIDSASGALHINSPFNDEGLHTLTIRITDSSGSFQEANLTLVVFPPPPPDIPLAVDIDNAVAVLSAPAILGTASIRLGELNGIRNLGYVYFLSLQVRGDAIAESGKFQSGVLNLGPLGYPGYSGRVDQFLRDNFLRQSNDNAPPGLAINPQTGVITRGRFIAPGTMRVAVLAAVINRDDADINTAILTVNAESFNVVVTPGPAVAPAVLTVLLAATANTQVGMVSVAFDDAPRNYTFALPV